MYYILLFIYMQLLFYEKQEHNISNLKNNTVIYFYS